MVKVHNNIFDYGEKHQRSTGDLHQQPKSTCTLYNTYLLTYMHKSIARSATLT